MEGTKSAGFSGCRYGGTMEEQKVLEGSFNLSAEVKLMHSEQKLS